MYSKDYKSMTRMMSVEWQSKDLFKILSSIKEVRTPAKTVRLNFFRTLKIKQRLAVIRNIYLNHKYKVAESW